MTTLLLAIGLMIVGLLLIVIEVLVIPGFGVIGVLGVLASLSSGYVAVTELEPGYAALTIAGGFTGALLLMWLGTRTRAAKAMVLETQTLGSAADPALRELVGCEGVTLTPLRPAGCVEIADKSIDVVSDGQYVEPGTRVRVIQVDGNRVVVEPAS